LFGSDSLTQHRAILRAVDIPPLDAYERYALELLSHLRDDDVKRRLSLPTRLEVIRWGLKEYGPTTELRVIFRVNDCPCLYGIIDTLSHNELLPERVAAAAYYARERWYVNSTSFRVAERRRRTPPRHSSSMP
jgi:hypothetical protein